MYLKERLLISLKPQNFSLARSSAKSHRSFIWIITFDLTIFRPTPPPPPGAFASVKTVFSFSEQEILLILEDELFVDQSCLQPAL